MLSALCSKVRSGERGHRVSADSWILLSKPGAAGEAASRGVAPSLPSAPRPCGGGGPRERRDGPQGQAAQDATQQSSDVGLPLSVSREDQVQRSDRVEHRQRDDGFELQFVAVEIPLTRL